jgi:hypothetical protein
MHNFKRNNGIKAPSIVFIGVLLLLSSRHTALSSPLISESGNTLQGQESLPKDDDDLKIESTEITQSNNIIINNQHNDQDKNPQHHIQLPSKVE